jgi:signal transduction histidine kinase
MRKSIWIFLLAVLLPSVVLGWLALRSAEEQKIILERRTAELYQKEADNVAAAARAVIEEQRRAFADVVRKLLAGEDPQQLATGFTTTLAATWPRKAVGFAIGKDGRLLSPTPVSPNESPELKKFLLENSAFLGGNLAVTVYPVPVDELNKPDQMRKLKQAPNAEVAQEQASRDTASRRIASAANKDLAKNAEPPQAKADPYAGKKALTKAEVIKPPAAPAEPKPAAPAAPRQEPAPATVSTPELPSDALKLADSEARRREASVRNVSPQQMFDDTDRTAVSTLWSATTEFRALVAENDEGMVTRFVQDRLDMIFWLRPAQAPDLVFGCLIEADSLRELWAAAMPSAEYRGSLATDASEFILALLDDKARPVITHPPGQAGRDWKRPFVASEIGEALPHWEAALYLMRPGQLEESARGVRRTLIFLIVAMLGAIACGGWLVVHDARRQLLLAQQKTDFVSNVSHELKTPLTSIRMFAELMQNGREETAVKAPQYLRIIIVEAERLTRLINNVLDFAKLERRQKRFDKKPLDLHEVIERTWEAHKLHLQESGFTTRWEAAVPPYPVIGDEDALAQILVNLLSNAEKYSGTHKEVALHTYLDGDYVCVSVLDRGSGVPAGEERKIFEAFYRAHDSLSNGIQGTGLGLTLAQRLAREHGGEIRYDRREGGGSNFTLRLPLEEKLRAEG